MVATLTLSLVLFLDAVKPRADEIDERWIVPILILGPGTGLFIAAGAVPLPSCLTSDEWRRSSEAPSSPSRTQW